MIKNFTLKFTECADLKIDAGGVVIFVGPNSSGKSLVLRELEQHFILNGGPQDCKIISDYEVETPNQYEVEELIEKSRQWTDPMR